MNPDNIVDFDLYNTRKLRQLENALAVAQSEQALAQAVSTSLATRLTQFQKTLASDQANATVANANLADARTTVQTIANAVPSANAARDQAVMISAKIDGVLAKAHDTAVLMVMAMNAIDELAKQVSKRKAKNELISDLVVTGVAQAQTDANAALTAITTALQSTMTAMASATQAEFATGKVIEAIARVLALMLPDAEHDQAKLANSPLWDEAVESIRALASIIGQKEIGALPLLAAIADLAARKVQDSQAITTQSALELNIANDKLNRATAAAASAAAALAAAQAAVA